MMRLFAEEIDKPNSVPDRNRAAIISLGHQSPDGSCGPPARLATSSRCIPPKRDHSHTWPCSCWGLPGRIRCRSAGRLLPCLFTLALVGSLFLWPCSARHHARTLSGSMLFGVRTFLRRIEPVRDRLDLFGVVILTLWREGVNGSLT